MTTLLRFDATQTFTVGNSAVEMEPIIRQVSSCSVTVGWGPLQDCTWSSGGSSDWSVPANWSDPGNCPPTDDERAIFDATSTVGVTIPDDASFGTLQIGSGYTGVVTFGGDVTTLVGVNQNGGTIELAGAGFTANLEAVTQSWTNHVEYREHARRHRRSSSRR